MVANVFLFFLFLERNRESANKNALIPRSIRGWRITNEAILHGHVALPSVSIRRSKSNVQNRQFHRTLQICRNVMICGQAPRCSLIPPRDEEKRLWGDREIEAHHEVIPHKD